MFLLILILALSTSVIALAVLVSLDGYGSRPAPRSHEADAFEPHVGTALHRSTR